MKLGKAIKKVAALAAGSSMLGATLMGAMAADLSDYPSPFVKDGVFSGMIVVGEKAATADVVGAIDIASSLQAAATTQVPVTVSGTGIEVTGGADGDVDFNSIVPDADGLDNTYTDSDIAGLFDGKIEFDEDDYDAHEEFTMSDDMVIETSLMGDEDFGADPYLVFDDRGTFGYKVVFEDTLPEADIGTDESGNLKLNFLGKEYEITDLNTTAGNMKIKSAAEYYMNVGGSLDVSGHTVKVLNIGQTSAVVDVDGQTKVVSSDGSSTKFDQAGGLRVEVKDIFYDETKEDRSCTVVVGDEIEMSISNGDSAELFGQPSDEEDAEWIWDIGTNYIGISYNQKRTKIGDAFEPLKEGEKVSLPLNYGYVSFDSLKTGSYETITISFDNVDLDNDATDLMDYDAVIFSSTGDESFVVAGHESDKIWLTQNGTAFQIWYQDDTEEKNVTAATFDIKLNDEALTVTPSLSGAWTIEDAGTVDSIELDISEDAAGDIGDDGTPGTVWKFFGAEEDAETTDVVVNTKEIGAKDVDVLTSYGIIVVDPEGNLDNDELVLKIPDEQQKAKIVVASAGTTVAGTSGSATSDKVNPIPVGLGVLDKDATVGSSNLIVVGGPCANTVAAELLDNPVPCGEGFEVGKAKLKLFQSGSKVSLLVAGYDAADTVAASKILADFEDYAADLTGMEVEVITSTKKVTSIQS